jgi:hypothetical protein
LDHFYAKRIKSPIRTIFKNFTLSVSLGYGNTFFNHKLDGFGVYQDSAYGPRIFPSEGAPGGAHYAGWVNQVMLDTAAFKPGSFVVSSDSATIGFRGKSLNLPFKVSLHYEYDRYRLGGGLSYEYMNMGTFKPTAFKDDLGNFQVATPNGWMRRYFVMMGASFYRWHDILFVADANVGSYKPLRNFDLNLINKGVYANVGVRIEHEFSEYLKVFIRPSFEIKNYALNLPETGKVINHAMNAWYLNVGLSYRLPELPRCYNRLCSAQINHAHGNKEYRSRMHGIFKKQNPHYGENFPKLFRYKRKNKKKLNPY